VIAYPLGDVVARHVSVHALRSAPGLCALVLLSAVGAVRSEVWLWRRHQAAAWITAAVLGLVVVVTNVVFLSVLFGEYSGRPAIYHVYHADLVEACDWLRPRLDDYDAVFVTSRGMNQPFAVTLVSLGYDPRRWLDEERQIETGGTWDIYTGYG